jgi:hypothetical protein
MEQISSGAPVKLFGAGASWFGGKCFLPTSAELCLKADTSKDKDGRKMTAKLLKF